jgi:plastocyanin
VRATVFVAAILCAAALAVPALGGEGASSSASKSIAVKDNFFKPKRTTLNGATFVTWKWRGNRRHNVHFTKAPGKDPRNCGTRRSGNCTRKLKRAGVYRYLCTLHGSMTGKIRIQ